MSAISAVYRYSGCVFVTTRLSDEHNKAVKKRIREEILLKKEDSYTLTETNGAIKTVCYTTLYSYTIFWNPT